VLDVWPGSPRSGTSPYALGVQDPRMRILGTCTGHKPSSQKNQNLRRRRGGILPKREVMSKRNSNELAARLHRRPQLFHSRVVRVNRGHLDPFPIRRKRFCAEEENQRKTTLHVLRSRRADMQISQIVELRRGRQCLRDSHRLRRRYPCGKLLQGVVDQGSGTTCGAIVDLFALGASLSGRANS
jgi:hypothetical protein